MSVAAATNTQASSSAANSNSAASSSSNSAATNDATTAYNTFLTLLTTQLTHQDPLNPTDSSQFTSQLIQLSSIEQQQQTNSQLASIASALNTVGLSTGVSYLDKTVVYDGNVAPLQDGTANWSYSLPSDAASVKITVTDSDGNTVFSGTGDATAGGHAFNWDGKDSDGNQLPDGNYTLTVTAVDSSGNSVSPTISGSGKVTGIDSSSGTTALLVGSVEVDLSSVIGVKS